MSIETRSNPTICDGTAPPGCCRPLTEIELRCPNCGSDLVMPTLLAPREVQCFERECSAIWTVD